MLYGNDALYYFLRFHHHLFDRMAAARRCARDRDAPTSLFSRAAPAAEAKDAVRARGGGARRRRRRRCGAVAVVPAGAARARPPPRMPPRPPRPPGEQRAGGGRGGAAAL